MGGAAPGRQRLRPPLLRSPPVRGELHVHPTQPVLPPGRRGAHPLPAAGAPCPQRLHREVLHQLLQQQGRQADGERAPGPQARPPVSSGAGNQPQGTSLTLPHVLLTPPPTSCGTGEGFPLRPSPVTVVASPESDPLWPGSLCLTSLPGWMGCELRPRRGCAGQALGHPRAQGGSSMDSGRTSGCEAPRQPHAAGRSGQRPATLFEIRAAPCPLDSAWDHGWSLTRLRSGSMGSSPAWEPGPWGGAGRSGLGPLRGRLLTCPLSTEQQLRLPAPRGGDQPQGQQLAVPLGRHPHLPESHGQEQEGRHPGGLCRGAAEPDRQQGPGEEPAPAPARARSPPGRPCSPRPRPESRQTRRDSELCSANTEGLARGQLGAGHRGKDEGSERARPPDPPGA